jgi:hypothetical protein
MASPAPWKDSGQLGFGRWITADDGSQVAVSYGPRVNPNSEANTRLIVAAPKLYDALRQICLVWDAGGKPGAHMIAAAHTALAAVGDWQGEG